MGEYEGTLKDIEKSLGIVPGFMKALPQKVLIRDWPLFKKYTLRETKIPAKYRELMGLAVAANIKCPYCSARAWLVGVKSQTQTQTYSLTLSQPTTLTLFHSLTLSAGTSF